jgi:hypothetical protein
MKSVKDKVWDRPWHQIYDDISILISTVVIHEGHRKFNMRILNEYSIIIDLLWDKLHEVG